MHRLIAVFLLLPFSVNAQLDSVNLHRALKKITNPGVDYYISNLTSVEDSAGRIKKVRLVMLTKEKQIKLVKKHGKALIPVLVEMLNDPIRDWAANLLLYYITQEGATTLRYYSFKQVDKWREIQKPDDVEKWQRYLKEGRVPNL